MCIHIYVYREGYKTDICDSDRAESRFPPQRSSLSLSAETLFFISRIVDFRLSTSPCIELPADFGGDGFTFIKIREPRARVFVSAEFSAATFYELEKVLRGISRYNLFMHFYISCL